MIFRVLRRIDYFRLYQRIKSFDSAKEFFPEFETYYSECLAQLKPVHDDYVNRISRADMAASLELGAFLCAACKSRRPRRVLDLGSGLSSFVLRSYARSNAAVTTVSVDDDSAWLGKTAQFLDEQGLEKENLLLLQDFLNTRQDPFDLILHDLNFVEVRINYVEAVLDQLAPGGLIIFDDVHKRDYLHSLLKLLRKRPGSCYSLQPVTADQFGRYALAYFAPPA
jgi:predicted O-methyltransferase YrrM